MGNTRLHGFVVSNTPGKGASLDKSASIELADTDRGLLINRLSTAERDAIQGAPNGLLIFNTSTNLFEYWGGSAWVEMDAAGVLPIDLASEVSGNLGVAHLDSGTNAGPNTVWAGDGTWKTLVDAEHASSLIINREFMVDQRNEGALVTQNSQGPLQAEFDQWGCYAGGGRGDPVVFTAQTVADENLPPRYSRCLEIKFQAAPTYHYGVVQLTQDIIYHPELLYGTPNATTLWAVGDIYASEPCTITADFGTFGGNFNFVHEIVLSTGWNHVSWAIPGYLASDIQVNDGGATYISFYFWPNGAAVAQTDVWDTTTNNMGPNQTDLTLTTATLRFAGFDIRPANAAFPFIHDSFENYLTECGQYYQKSYAVGSPANNWTGIVPGTATGLNTGSMAATGTIGITNSARSFFTTPGMIQAPAVTFYDGNGSAGKVDYHDGGGWHNAGVLVFGGFLGYTPALLGSVFVDGPAGSDDLAFDITLDAGF